MSVAAQAGSIKLKPLTAEERRLLESSGRPAVAGVHRPLPSGVLQKGKWKKLPDSRHQWRLEIHSPGARALRVYFEGFDVTAGEVRVCEKDGRRCYGPYTGRGPVQEGPFWSDVVDGSTLLVQYTAAARALRLPFQIAKISHQK
jgi:hypothetical protein